MPSTMYRTECLRLLNDLRSYLPITIDPTARISKTIRDMVYEAECHGWITPKEAVFLHKKDPITPYFYILPKIHKGISPPPGRPIVSGINSLLEPLSQFCDFFLQPLVKCTSTYLQDTKQVLNLINTINTDRKASCRERV